MASSTTTTSDNNEGDAMFGKFLIPADSIFYRSSSISSTIAFVNLRPIVPGHVLVMPRRCVATLEELTLDEYVDVWTSVRTVQAGLRLHYTNCTAFNVAVQDGRAAGQSVPHVHVHILPRCAGDLDRNDDIYDALQEWAPRDELKVALAPLEVPDDTERRDRTKQEMADEAASYREKFQLLNSNQ